jgi:hypothetical protein
LSNEVKGQPKGPLPAPSAHQPEQALANMATIQGDTIFLLKDFVRYYENDKISRRLRDLADGFRTARRSIVLLAATIELPKELVADAAEFQLGLALSEELLPDAKRVLAEVNLDQGVPVALDIAALGQVPRNLIGLPKEEATDFPEMPAEPWKSRCGGAG